MPKKNNSDFSFRIPSARKSIHNHGTYCPFASREMGRYGCSKNINSGSSHLSSLTSHDQGSDEVDNVMSKFAKSTSIRVSKTNAYKRRNSSPPPLEQQSDFSDDDCVLAKSLPTYLRPNSYSSDDSQDESLQSNPQKYSEAEISTDNIHLRRSPQNRYNTSQNREITNLSENSLNTSKFSSGPIKILILLLLLLFGLLSVGGYYSVLFTISHETTHINYYDELRFCNDVNNLRLKYKISENSILQVQSGISTICDRQDTGSFIFAYDSKSVNFDSVKFDNFMQDIATTSSRYLRNNTEMSRHIVITSSVLTMETHDELINKYREVVNETGIMLVKEMDQIPSNLAMAFHYYCDEYNPLVKRSAIFFTLDLRQCPYKTEPKTSHAFIEKCLASKWSGVPEDNIRPLLTRVVNVVIDATKIF